MTAPVAGGGVLDMERDARTIYDIACIREEGQSATREDVEFKAIALRNFNSVSAVAELIAADKEYDEARELVRFCAQPQPRYPAQVLNERHPAMLRMAAAADRRAAALSNIEGAST